MKNLICIFIVLIVFMFAAAETSFACSCVASSDPPKKQIENSYSGANAVLSGEVVEIKQSPTNKSIFS